MELSSLLAPKSLAHVYTTSLHQHFEVMYASWPPSEPLQLGDYGILRNRLFTRLGNLREYGLQFAVRRDSTEDVWNFASSDAVDVRSIARGNVGVDGVATQHAQLRIGFSKKRAVYFYAAQCTLNSVENHTALGENLIALTKEQRWASPHVVITSLLTSGNSTIVGSLGQNASLTLEAESAALEHLDLADSSVAIRLASAHNVGIRVFAQHGLTPLMRLSKVFLPRWWTRRSYRFQPEYRAAPMHLDGPEPLGADGEMLGHDYGFHQLR